MSIGKRLVQIRKSQNPKLSQVEFAELLNMSRSAYSMYELDKSTPTGQTIELICTKFNINRSWLEEGVGDMNTTPPPSGLPAEVQAILGHDNPFAVAVISALLQMPRPWWEAWEAEYDRVIGRTEEQKEGNG